MRHTKIIATVGVVPVRTDIGENVDSDARADANYLKMQRL